MSNNLDQPVQFHKSFHTLLDTFRNVIASVTWLKVSTKSAVQFYETSPYIIGLDCSVTAQKIKLDKSILTLIETEGVNQPTPLYSKTLINFYRIFTIAIKDAIWEESTFQPFLMEEHLEFLKHLRNASAHNNQFFWGKNKTERTRIMGRLPVTWRGKTIKKETEGVTLYMDFMKPGDIFLLLSDISTLV